MPPCKDLVVANHFPFILLHVLVSIFFKVHSVDILTVCHDCPFLPILSWRFLPVCFVWAFLSRMHCFGCPFPGCPLPAVLSLLRFLAVLSCLFFPGCSALSVLSWLSCSFCLFPAIPGLAILCYSFPASCPSCPVLAAFPLLS